MPPDREHPTHALGELDHGPQGQEAQDEHHRFAGRHDSLPIRYRISVSRPAASAASSLSCPVAISQPWHSVSSPTHTSRSPHMAVASSHAALWSGAAMVPTITRESHTTNTRIRLGTPRLPSA